MIENEIKEIKTAEELSNYIKPLYIMENYFRSESDYLAFQNKMYNLIKGCFHYKECRTYPVKFKFYTKDTKVHTIEFRMFIVNIFAWYPFINLSGISNVLNESFIITPSMIPNITDYINEKIILTLRDYSIKNTIVNRSVSEVCYNLRGISIDFSLIMNLSISSETFLNMYKNNDDLRRIMNTKIPDGISPSDGEILLNNITNEEIDILKREKDNPLGIILRAGTGIKNKQLTEFIANIGYKPDLSGNTIPIPINSNTLIGGLKTPSDHYIDASAARKSQVMNKKVMGTAGYFGKIVLLLTRTLVLSKTVSDCDTKHLLEINIESQKMLNKYNGRYYKLNKNHDLLLINSKTDKHLIGKTIYLRSPITCACGNDEVCHKCFGTTSLLNLDISDGVSGFETEEVTKVINQMILSSKHLLTTVSKKIKFNDEFYKFFNINAGEISPILQNDIIDDLDNWAIWIDPNDIQKSDEMDDDSAFNTYINDKFYIQNLLTKDCIEIFTEDSQEMYFTDDTLQLLKKGKGYIKFKDMEDDTVLFELSIMNNELTKPLYEIMDLVGKEKKFDINMTYSEMSQKFTNLLLDSKIDAMALSGELIINRLIRKDPDEDFLRPDFSKDDIGPYKIYNVLKALEKNKSPLIGLSSQNIKRQLLSDDIVDKKDGTSYVDLFFKKKTSTKRLNEIHQKLMKYKNK